jgi:hypothetical protein
LPLIPFFDKKSLLEGDSCRPLADERLTARALGEHTRPREVILIESSPQGGSTMFDQIFERSDALRRQFAGPLREARLAYLRHRAEQGAARSTLRVLAQYLLAVIKYLNLEEIGTVTTTQIKQAADHWARRRLKHHKIKGGFSRKSKSCFVCVASNWLRFLGRLQAPRPHRFAELVADFARYMEQQKESMANY